VTTVAAEAHFFIAARVSLDIRKPAHQLAYDNPLFSEWREDILRPSPQLIVAH
jgi:hypothetical protein